MVCPVFGREVATSGGEARSAGIIEPGGRFNLPSRQTICQPRRARSLSRVQRLDLELFSRSGAYIRRLAPRFSTSSGHLSRGHAAPRGSMSA